MPLVKQTFVVELSDIPDKVIPWDEFIGWQEANNYSSYTLYIENPDEIKEDDYNFKYGGFLNLKGQDLIDKWKEVREWLTRNGLPETEDKVQIKVYW